MSLGIWTSSLQTGLWVSGTRRIHNKLNFHPFLQKVKPKPAVVITFQYNTSNTTNTLQGSFTETIACVCRLVSMHSYV